MNTKTKKRSAGVLSALAAVVIAYNVMIQEGQDASIIPVDIANAPLVKIAEGTIVIGGNRARLLLNRPNELWDVETVDELVSQLDNFILDLKREHPTALDFIKATRNYRQSVVRLQREMVLERNRAPPN